MRVELLEEARLDLVEAYDYIAEDNPSAARRTIKRIREHILALVKHPWMAPVYPDVPNVRRLVISGTHYLAFYRVNEAAGRVEVLRVLHSARQSPTGFREAQDG